MTRCADGFGAFPKSRRRRRYLFYPRKDIIICEESKQSPGPLPLFHVCQPFSVYLSVNMADPLGPTESGERVLDILRGVISVNKEQTELEELLVAARAEITHVKGVLLKGAVAAGPLLTALLENTPTNHGKEYVAGVILFKVNQDLPARRDFLEQVASAWLTHLLASSTLCSL